MATLYDIRERAEALSRKLEAGSITPEEVGRLIVDLTDYTQGMERDGSTLGIGKVYPTLEAMQADTAPVGDNGKFSQYVVFCLKLFVEACLECIYHALVCLGGYLI